jgi:hypothetical protein
MKRILFVIFVSNNYYNYMLINFSFGNFRSFRDIKSLSMEAGRVDDLTESVIEKDGFCLLPVAAIYGANSSGKSNVFKAMGVFRYIVIRNSKLDPGDTLFQDPFLLDVQTQEAPTVFEIQFLLDSTVYRYGFEYLSTEIDSEWLYERKIEPNSKEHVLFYREGEDFTLSTKYFPEGKNKKELTTKNRLFLSLVAQLNGNISQKLIKYLRRCNTISGIEGGGYEKLSLEMIEHHSEGYQEAMELFKKLDLGFTEIEVEEKEVPNGLKERLAALQDINPEKLQDAKVYETYTTHNVYDKEGKVVGHTKFSAENFESNGTNKVISFSGPLFNTLLKGKVLFVDELDAKLHPMLTRAIVRLFMDKETNPKGAQLVFTTHDTHLLDKEYLRRDQVWFTEKDATEASDLYSLLEFKERNDRNFEKNYIEGRYGAIPFIR